MIKEILFSTIIGILSLTTIGSGKIEDDIYPVEIELPNTNIINPYKNIEFDIYYSICNLNLRFGPGTETKIACTVPTNTRLITFDYDENSEWTIVEYNGENYFCATKYLSNEEVEYPLYSINNLTLEKEYQNYIYQLCIDFNIENYYTTILCMCYQESKFNTSSYYCPNGYDWGIMQIRYKYANELAKQLNIDKSLDIRYNVYDNLYLGIKYFATLIYKYNGDIDHALSHYNQGQDCYYWPYITQVRQWESYLKKE